MAIPATAHATPCMEFPMTSEAYPSNKGAIMYVPSPNALGNPNAVASLPTGACCCARATRAGPAIVRVWSNDVE